jgi:hypothetical protein
LPLKKILLSLLFVILTASPVLAAIAADSDGSIHSRTSAGDIRVLRRDIRVILADPRFHYPDHWSWLRKSWHKLLQWLTKFKPKQFKVNLHLKKVLQWLGFICLVLLPLLLIYILPKMFIRTGAIKALTKGKSVSAAGSGSVDLKMQAGLLAEKGQFREAIRLLYLAGLEHLKKNGILPEGLRLTDKAALNIVSRTFGPANPGCQAFKELLLVFQEKWYGLRSCEAQDYYRLSGYLKMIETALGKPHV